MHTHTCGELRAANIGEEVTLTGWVSRRRDHGGLIFCDLRDREGITQINFDPEHSDGDAFKIAETMRPDGWVSRRRDHGGLIFCDLRDREGITQINFDPEHSDGDAFKIAETMRPEWPICVHGVVRYRGEDAVNPKLATGEIEVLIDHATVLNRSKTPPFQIEDGIETAEDTRLRYRYLDLRRPEMAARLRLRSDFTFADGRSPSLALRFHLCHPLRAA